jgi:HlyD family secretion protein
VPDRRTRGRLSRPRRSIVVGAAAVIVLAAAGIGAYAATASSGISYRTARVGKSSVTKTLAETGTAAPETSATASFANAGTVQSVSVRAGQAVTAGQMLAQLGTVTLNATLQAAKATAAHDALVLAAAENGQTLSAGGTRGSSGAAGGSFSANTSAYLSTPGSSVGSATLLSTTSSHDVLLAAARPSHAPGSGTASISTLQGTVTGGQKALDNDLSDAQTDLTAAEFSCPSGAATPSGGGRPSPTDDPSEGATPSASASPSTSPTETPPPSSSPTAGPTSCLTAEAALLAVQRKVAADEASLARAESALDSALTAAEHADSSSTGGTGTAHTGGAGGTGTAASGSGSTAVPTAADIAADQAAVDAANAAVTVAQQNLSMATLVSPISGTVLSVDLTAGASASGKSIVVAAPDAYVFTTAVPVASIPDVKVGQSVAVTPDGTNTVVHGTVVLIAAAPNSSGSYPVVVGIAGTPTNVRSGSTASLVITLSASDAGLTVPTSAITTVGSRTIVRLLSGSTVTAVPITVITMGSVQSQVRATGQGALAAGDRVVIADLGAPLPASNSTTTTRGGLSTGLGGTSGLGGAAGFGGGTARGASGRG